jgi:hypothetical protein
MVSAKSVPFHPPAYFDDVVRWSGLPAKLQRVLDSKMLHGDSSHCD